MSTLTIASRYLVGRKLRTFLTTLAIVFGVFVIFGMNVLIPTMVEAFMSNVMAATGHVDMTITLKTGEAFSPDTLETVRAVQGVRVAVGYLKRTLNLPADYFDHDPGKPDQVGTLALVGVPADTDEIHSTRIVEGRFLGQGEVAEAVITRTLADSLNVKPGGTLNLPTAVGVARLTVVGLLPARTLPGNEEVWVTLPEAQKLLGQPSRINAIEANLATSTPQDRARVEQAVKDALGKTYDIGTLATGTEILNSVTAAQVAFSLFGFFALLMGGFIIFNTFRTVVVERRTILACCALSVRAGGQSSV